MSNDLATLQANENKKLNVFIGKWRTTGDIYDHGKISGKVNSVDTYEWLPGEYALIHYADSKMGDLTIHGIEIIGYDPMRKTYYGPFFDDQGSVGWEALRVQGNTWTWHGEKVMGVNYHRCTAIFKDENTIAAKHERSDDDKTWHLWIDITLNKIV